MGAHRLYCYAPQRDAAVAYLQDLGAIVTSDCPAPVNDPEEVAGVETLNFIVVKNHAARIPQRLWECIVERGAVILDIDDQYVRDGRVPVRHYPAAGDASAATR